MNLGTFSISLNVKNIDKSIEFYQQLGFVEVAGDRKENWIILANGEAKIGLFQGMFDQNIMTFNPSNIRPIQEELVELGIDFGQKMSGEEWPNMAMFKDPDGNQILIDQH